jgi:hypothetical protein
MPRATNGGCSPHPPRSLFLWRAWILYKIMYNTEYTNLGREIEGRALPSVHTATLAGQKGVSQLEALIEENRQDEEARC